MLGKAVIYQLLPRLWGNPVKPVKGGTLSRNGCGRFSAIDEATLDYLHGTLRVTHLWLTGVIRHACAEEGLDWVKGRAGSPYAISDYFDVNPYLADNPDKRIDEFKQLVKRIHAAGMKLIIDFVPNHVARNHGPFFGADDDTSVHWRPENDFFYYPGEPLVLPFVSKYKEFPAKASGNVFSPAPGRDDWYDTVKLNYCDFHTHTWDKMARVLDYWCSLGVDGFRCDMVELIPWQAMKWLVESTRRNHPDTVFIAEVYRTDLYPLYAGEVGFDALYDKSGLYDALHDIMVYGDSCRRITAVWQMLGAMQPGMLNFLENHDEQRLASDFFAGSAAVTYAALSVSALFNTAPFMVYAGQEAGERGMDEEGFSGRDGRTSIFDWWSPTSLRALYAHIHGEKGLSGLQKSILAKYTGILSLAREDTFSKGETYDLCYCNEGSEGFNPDRHFAFLRSYKGKGGLVVANFSDSEALMDIRIPAHAYEFLGLKETVPNLFKVKVKAGDCKILQF